MRFKIILLVLLLVPLSLATNNLQYHNASQIYPEIFGAGGFQFQDYLHVGSYDGYSTDTGDFFTSGHIQGNSSVTTVSTPYGFGLMASDSNQGINFSSTGGTATMDATNKVICDTTEPWKIGGYISGGGHEDMFLTVLSSTPTDYRGATGEIIAVVNSSCIRISIAAAGLRSIDDLTSMTYVVYKPPIFATLDRGDIHAHIGRNEDAKFHIFIPDGRGPYGFHIEDVAGANQHQSLTVDTDINNHDGVVGFNQYLYSSLPADGKEIVSTLLEFDGSGISNSHTDFISAVLIGAGTNNEIDFAHVDPNVDHIIYMGSIDEVSAVYYYDGTTNWNITGNVTSAVYDYTVFANDNDVLYIGNDVNFTTIAFSLETVSSQGILPFYYYCNLTGQWGPLPAVVDTTAGFTVSGSITFTSPSDRGKCNTDMDGNSLGPTNYSYIAINRTRNFIVTPPVENLISISGGTDYFVLQKDMMRLQPVTTPPHICDATVEGATYYDLDLHLECSCTGTNWVQKDDWSTVCS